MHWKGCPNLTNSRHLPPSRPTTVPDKPANEEIERLHRRREELKKQSAEIEQRLEQLQTELKKVTGRIVLPDEAAPKKPQGGNP